MKHTILLIFAVIGVFAWPIVSKHLYTTIPYDIIERIDQPISCIDGNSQISPPYLMIESNGGYRVNNKGQSRIYIHNGDCLFVDISESGIHRNESRFECGNYLQGNLAECTILDMKR